MNVLNISYKALTNLVPVECMASFLDHPPLYFSHSRHNGLHPVSPKSHILSKCMLGSAFLHLLFFRPWSHHTPILILPHPPSPSPLPFDTWSLSTMPHSQDSLSPRSIWEVPFEMWPNPDKSPAFWQQINLICNHLFKFLLFIPLEGPESPGLC